LADVRKGDIVGMLRGHAELDEQNWDIAGMSHGHTETDVPTSDTGTLQGCRGFILQRMTQTEK
jgi:hypothetical protein